MLILLCYFVIFSILCMFLSPIGYSLAHTENVSENVHLLGIKLKILLILDSLIIVLDISVFR